MSTEDEYVFIEANERPGLANHEPQPTAAAFVDYPVPDQPGLPQAWTPDRGARLSRAHHVLVRNTISAASCAVDSSALRRASSSTSRKSP